MPIPRQSKLNLVDSKLGASLGESSNWLNLEQTFQRLPFFPVFEKDITFPAGSTIITAQSAVEMFLTGDGYVRVPVFKQEEWTDMVVRIEMSGWTSVAPTRVNFGGQFVRPKNAADTFRCPQVGRYQFGAGQTSDHRFMAGQQRVSGIRPGRWEFRPSWWVDGTDFRFNTNSTLYISVAEMIPPAVYFQL
jgi:hypothetical protein